MDYVSERITNIADLEKALQQCYAEAQMLHLVLKEKESSPDVLDNSLKLVNALKYANEFEFKIERRKTSYC